uniref:Uncharacterized protein n=1 Tax=Arundo donax TaxID=35708 RepID=A0A0A9BGN7_ARUDO
METLVPDPGNLNDHKVSFEDAQEAIKSGEIIKLGDICRQSMENLDLENVEAL